ncbi:MAG: bis(5'-nucleosyl)-tetraphosphatase (symmetrical) YqeK [Candidatus Eremiobacteraeota bacterium]|nr:bis(5'-nucleosyl)-tetraphosphatase (symmetrical) YqeK [Candidatus Eremiobacteraeota bacterium]
MTDDELGERVLEHLGQRHRYEHCCRVAQLAATLARAHGLDPVKAHLAGMLHDLARLYSSDRLLAETRKRKLPLGDFERCNPVVLHAPLGAALAQETFGVTDAQVLSAIAKHTVADGRMSPLDCVVYLADGLEPGRNFPHRAELVALAERDLDAAMRATIASTLRYLKGQGIPVAPQTAEAARTFGLSLSDLEAGTG